MYTLFEAMLDTTAILRVTEKDRDSGYSRVMTVKHIVPNNVAPTMQKYLPIVIRTIGNYEAHYETLEADYHNTVTLVLLSNKLSITVSLENLTDSDVEAVNKLYQQLKFKST